MLTKKQLKNFAKLVVTVGVNLQKNQDLYINAPIECADIARQLAEAGYKCGAKEVTVIYGDEKLSRINIDYAKESVLCNVSEWKKLQRNDIVDKRACVISISAGDPNIFSGADLNKVANVSLAQRKAFEKYYEASMSNFIRWCVISVPTENWAKKVYPSAKNAKQAVNSLWESIAKSMRLDEANPIKAWQTHINTLHRRADLLNKYDFDHLLLKSANGTDLSVGLAEGHLWLAAREMGQDNVPFTANMPTEEIFTAPHKYKVNGKLHNALPLVENGTIIDNFTITFKDGKVVDYTAEQGYEALKHLIETDEGSSFLGEVALIGKNSPIAQMNTLFFNTLFDENASCHLAIGKAYPTTVKNGNSYTREQLDELGVNYSIEHCDFMIGTSDFSVVGVTKNNEKVTLFVDGDWVV